MKPMRKIIFYRIADVFLPAALAGACFFDAGTAARFYACALALRAIGLCTCGAVRQAFAVQPGLSDVRRSVNSALLVQLIACAVGIVLMLCTNVCSGWGITRQMVAAACLINCEGLFTEHNLALGDETGATASHGLAALCVMSGIALRGAWTLTAGAALGMLISLANALVTARGWSAGLSKEPFRHIPRALLYGLLYPAVMAALMIPFKDKLSSAGFAAGLMPETIAYFIGLAVYAMSESPFRRTRLEAYGLRKSLLITCGIALALGIVSAASGLFLARLCAEGVSDGARLLANGVIRAAGIAQNICVSALIGGACAYINWGSF